MLVAGGDTPGTVDGARFVGKPGVKGPAPHVDFSCSSLCFFDFPPGTQVRLWPRDDGSAKPDPWFGSLVRWGNACRMDPCDVVVDSDTRVVASFVTHALAPLQFSEGIPAAMPDEAGNFYSMPSDLDYGTPRIEHYTLESRDATGGLRFSVPILSGPLMSTLASLRMTLGNKVFTAENSSLIARATADGSVVWRRDFSAHFELPYLGATASDGHTIFIGLKDEVAAISPADGSLVWETPHPVNCPLIVDEAGNIYSSQAECAHGLDDCTTQNFSLDPSGRLRWERTTSYRWGYPAGVAGGVLVTQAGEILDAATGAPRGSGLLAPFIGDTLLGIADKLVIAPDGTVVAVNGGSTLDAYDGNTGQRIWSTAAFDLFWFSKPQLTTQGVMLMDGEQVRTVGLDGSTPRGTWLEALVGYGALLDNGLFFSANSRRVFALPGSPRLARHGWIGAGGGPTGQFRAR